MNESVVHCKRSSFDLYIGRANGAIPASKWANPWIIGKDGTREEVIARYEDYVRADPVLMASLPEIRGKILGCWCAPQHCHGDTLIKLLNEIDPKPMSDITPIFSTHYSYGTSILTLEEVGKTEVGNPISICDLALEYGLKQVTIVDDHIDGFIEAYKNLNKIGSQLIYGVKLVICADMTAKDEASLKTESKVIVFVKNTQGYSDLIRLWNRAWTDGFYYQGRLDWKTLKEFWTPNLTLALPFFSSFIKVNTLSFSSIVPEFPCPTSEVWCLKEVESGVPFASLINKAVDEFIAQSGAQTQDVKSIYYAKPEDFETYQTFRAIDNHSTYGAPNVSHMCSDQFSFEAWKELTVRGDT